MTGLKEHRYHSDWVICFAEGLAFYNESNYEMSMLRFFASLDTLIELMYSYASNVYSKKELEKFTTENGIPAGEIEKIVKAYSGERKRLLQEKLRPVLKSFNLCSDNINDIINAFEKAEDKRNAIAHGEICKVDREEIVDFLYTYMTMLTQITCNKEICEYINFKV